MEFALALFAVHNLPAALGILAALLVGVTLTYTGTNLGALDQLGGTLGPYLDQELSGVGITGGGAIGVTHGTLFITDAGVGAYTLAAPVAGAPAAGGNDGQTLRIVDGTGHAHTITTPANGINGNKHIATCAGNIGDEIVLRPFNGKWITNPTNTGFTLT
jgi:hypothetical protein